MKIHFPHKLSIVLLLSFLLSLLSFSAIAEDSSCELKNDDDKNMTKKSGNEFTRDKTWHFSADSILLEEEVFSSSNKKKDTSANSKNTPAKKI